MQDVLFWGLKASPVAWTSWGLRISKLQFFIKEIAVKFFLNFGHQNPGPRLDPDHKHWLPFFLPWLEMFSHAGRPFDSETSLHLANKWHVLCMAFLCLYLSSAWLAVGWPWPTTRCCCRTGRDPRRRRRRAWPGSQFRQGSRLSSSTE